MQIAMFCAGAFFHTGSARPSTVMGVEVKTALRTFWEDAGALPMVATNLDRS
jgi:hypothetical protein